MKLVFAKKSVMVALAGVLAAGSSQAVVCLAPTPVCGLVIVGGLIASIYASRDHKDSMDVIAIEQNQAKLQKIVNRLKGSDYVFRMQKYAKYSGGYNDVITRYNRGKISGNMSLETLMDFNPRLFADLDALARILAKEYGQDLVEQIYGPQKLDNGYTNWKRYQLLAQDSLILYAKSFKN